MRSAELAWAIPTCVFLLMDMEWKPWKVINLLVLASQVMACTAHVI